MGFSCSSKYRRVFALPVASSKVRSFTSFFCFGIAAFASSSLSAAFSDFLIYGSSSGVVRSSSVNFKREVEVRKAVASCSFLTAFLFAFRVCAASRCSMTRSAAALSGCEKSLSASRLLIRSAVCCVSLTSTAPSRVIFCVILSRGFSCLIVLHLQSSPSQGRNILRLIQSRYNGGQGFLPQARSCRFQKTGL